jgi:hypothetical protein
MGEDNIIFAEKRFPMAISLYRNSEVRPKQPKIVLPGDHAVRLSSFKVRVMVREYG